MHCWTFTFHEVANSNFRVRIILVYLTKTRLIPTLEPSFTHCTVTTLVHSKMPIMAVHLEQILFPCLSWLGGIQSPFSYLQNASAGQGTSQTETNKQEKTKAQTRAQTRAQTKAQTKRKQEELPTNTCGEKKGNQPGPSKRQKIQTVQQNTGVSQELIERGHKMHYLFVKAAALHRSQGYTSKAGSKTVC